MKKMIFIGMLLLITNIVWAQIQKSDLQILYVGGTGVTRTLDESPLENEVLERMADFEQMLKKYFKTVKVINAKDYHYSMSERYDVTIMDGIPEEIAPEERAMDRYGYMSVKKAKGYFPESFDRPVLLIAEMGERVGRRLGVKADWYCLCLDAKAHGMRMDHPIFHGPFPVNLTIRKEPTPSDAFHYAYKLDYPVPDSIFMWRVQKKGYMTHENYRPGMVSRPGGFEDSPDAEYISSGVCAKSLDAVAIGRHGNFFHWGFVSSPKDLTGEAQTVLANAIVYISGFAGKTLIARKYIDGIATRYYIRELKELASRKGWLEAEKEKWRIDQLMLEEKALAQAKKASGEKLNKMEEMKLEYEPSVPVSYADFLKKNQGELFDRFGEDEEAYMKYYDENYDYFYGGGDYYLLRIDEDVKSLGIPNNDLRLLDKAISMLEEGMDVEKANRILKRYTLCRFVSPGEWRNWYETYKDRLFFTESGGWLFLVNTYDAVPGNDYSVLEAEEKNTLVKSSLGTTDKEHPVKITVELNQLDNGNREIKIRVRIHAGYHIYAHVAGADAFIPTSVEFTLPHGFQLIGELKRPSYKAFNDRGTTIYEKEAVFRQEIVGSGEGNVICVVGYQCCDSNVCFPPVSESYTIKIQ